ncbi:hypothetical protein SE15_02725 [Thermanaerothrix daxensis]|uniref:Uncharacterized protein n=1 Tax=Thermanaerothrix daxensis TaxID=869279 RepID=A0A0P6XMS5_9CHLR|nr:flagellar protein FlaG [Thermanaerothrix daxensis]KPL84110.1 hypothetical protein SE15_02725 [Thermanaerothrix daxensis]
MQGEAKLQVVGPVTAEIGGRVPVESGASPQKPLTVEAHNEARSEDVPARGSGTFSPARSSAEIALRFQVDPQTRQVTVFVLDKTHRHVIRTIPPEEMARLRAGEIIDLFV